MCDQRLVAASEIFVSLLKQDSFDPKYLSFIREINANVQLTLNNKPEARKFYAQVLSAPANAFPISLKRSKEMMKLLE